jgi:hypothetical protein
MHLNAVSTGRTIGIPLSRAHRITALKKVCELSVKKQTSGGDVRKCICRLRNKNVTKSMCR